MVGVRVSMVRAGMVRVGWVRVGVSEGEEWMGVDGVCKDNVGGVEEDGNVRMGS